MSNLFKLFFNSQLKRVSTSSHLLPNCLLNAPVLQPASRSLWHMASPAKINNILRPVSVTPCLRWNHAGLSHSDGEKDLVEFLQGEIAQEKKSLKMKSLPADLDGFAIDTNQAELIFTKKSKTETVTVSMSVNHSVDTEDVGEDGEFLEEMKARPAFNVEIVRNGKTLSFTCSFVQLEKESDKDAEDNFEITEITYFEGEWNDKTYAVAADLLDENLYDLFMVILEEKGITKKFVEKVSEIATSHEHSQYIRLLENVKKFSSVN